MSQTTEMPPPDTTRLLVVSGICSFSDGNTDIPIEKTPFVLGRWEKCDGVVKPLEVSRKHCEIRSGQSVANSRSAQAPMWSEGQISASSALGRSKQRPLSTMRRSLETQT